MSTNEKTETCKIILPDYLQKLLDDIAAREGFAAGYSINTAPGSNVGDGFQSLMLRTEIVGRRHGKDNGRLELICKVPPLLEIRRSMVAMSFRQEVFAYETLLPTLVELQTSKHISVADGFYSFPKCYGTYSNEDTNEFAIVLEDLKSRDFRMWNKLEPMDYAHAKHILAQMGKYHALSFALRVHRPDFLEKFALREGCGQFEALVAFPMADKFYITAFDQAIAALGPDDAALKDKVAKLRDNYRDVLKTVSDGKNAEPFSVINHGDCWNNNMMFDYGSEDRASVKSVCLIDWQLVQYCSPATDLAYFFYSSTEHELRQKHLDDLYSVYHSSLSKLLTQLGCDAESLFGYNEFIEQLKNFSIYAMVLCPVMVQIMTCDPKDIPDMDNAENFESLDNIDFVGQDSSAFDARIRDVFRDFDERGYFDSKYFSHA